MGTVLEKDLHTRQHLAEEVQIELEENVQFLSNEPNPPWAECAGRMEKEAERPAWHCWCGGGGGARE